MQAIKKFILSRVRRLLSQPAEELTRMQRTLQYAIDLVRHCTGQLRNDRATQMAAALTYRTIFSLVPTIILSLLVFRAFVSLEDAQGMLQNQVYEFFDFSTIQVQATGDGSTQQTIQDRLTEFVTRGYQLNVASVGGVGLLLLVWASLAMLATVEECFNRIFNCRAGRAWLHRIVLYWAVLTLGPVLLMVSLYLAGQLYGTASNLPVVGTLFGMLSSFAALGASWLLLLLLYMLLPNTPVKLRPAIIGSLVAAILWELGKVGFKYYVTKAVTFSVLYGSLGLIPLFLFWLYITWLVVLFGLELTYALQVMSGRQLRQEKKIDERDLITDTRCVLPMMTAIGQAFEQGGSVTREQLAQQLQLPGPITNRFCDQLEDAGMIHHLHHGGYTLARPADQIAIADLLKLARSIAHLALAEPQSPASPDAGSPPRSPGTPTSPGWAMLAELNALETEASRNRSLAHLLKLTDASDDKPTDEPAS